MLAGRNPEMTRLAMVDAIMERSLSVRERALMTTIPTLLGAHFERLRKAEQSAQEEAEAAEMPPPAKPGAWLDTFRKDMRSVLLAELDIRFQPVEGLLAALRTRYQDTMSRYLINLVVFLVGLAAAGWIGAGYVGSNPLALGVTLLIALFYMAGAFELYRYGRATSGLRQAVAGLEAPPASLAGWLDSLPPSLRHAARLRIEGERAALPGPSLTPYLVGLLVLLGMLGTFLGMVVTLRAPAWRWKAPPTARHPRLAGRAGQGLGFAFGTSIAGVATSAMLGLLSALCRRDRILASQQFDARVATTLRPYSQSYQREETLKLLQRQADALPALAERLQAMIDAVERQGQAMNDRQLASQDAFQGKAEAAYSRLAASVEQTLKASVADSARAAGAALQPVVEATMTGLARETAAARHRVRRGPAPARRPRPPDSANPPPTWPASGRARWTASSAPTKRWRTTCASRWISSPPPSSSVPPR